MWTWVWLLPKRHLSISYARLVWLFPLLRIERMLVAFRKCPILPLCLRSSIPAPPHWCQSRCMMSFVPLSGFKSRTSPWRSRLAARHAKSSTPPARRLPFRAPGLALPPGAREHLSLLQSEFSPPSHHSYPIDVPKMLRHHATPYLTSSLFSGLSERKPKLCSVTCKADLTGPCSLPNLICNTRVLATLHLYTPQKSATALNWVLCNGHSLWMPNLWSTMTTLGLCSSRDWCVELWLRGQTQCKPRGDSCSQTHMRLISFFYLQFCRF